MNRRDFIKVVSTAGSGLVLGFYLPSTNKLNGKPVAVNLFEPNAWIKVRSDNIVQIMVGKSEMGQGVLTSLPMIIAEEMDLDFSKVVVEKATADRKKYGWQMTGGSNSVSGGYKKLRKAGATAREMLVMAAAQEWGVSKNECKTNNGIVIHEKTGRELSYGELAEKASQQKVPKKPLLKDKKDFSIIGQNVKRTDTLSKINGTAEFAMDVQLDGMVYATMVHSPVFGGKLKSFNKASVSDISGVIKIFEIESGLAIVAKNTWGALKVSKQIEIKWDEGEAAGLDDEMIRKDLINASKEKGAVVRNEGNVKNALKSSDNIIEALYESPLQAHATMEPMNCTVYVHKNKCEVWAGTQDPNGARKIASKITGLSKKQVEVNVTFLGGGFGRRAFNDYVSEAVEISNEMKKPVKMIWSREEDMQHDYYRPSSVHVMVGAFDQNNNITTFKHRVVAPSILFTQLVKIPFPFKEKADIIAVEGAKHLPYEIPNMQVDYQMTKTAVPLGFWRSVYNSQNAFATECFMDELAEKAGKDPVQFRLGLLSKSSRDAGVIKMVVEKSGWNDFQNGSTYQGMSCHKSFGTWVAQVARVSVENGQVKV
ncbi:MAG: molybdopterin cofactor-binding domain-containing protein, partial [Candidatus Marinimicrobia bacterium]|nr:molybdopterin cofactor-binding domain-containing protein [Candidatus Neomarinimicrobiota bacterium]